jgi:hypothetical protein
MVAGLFTKALSKGKTAAFCITRHASHVRGCGVKLSHRDMASVFAAWPFIITVSAYRIGCEYVLLRIMIVCT